MPASRRAHEPQEPHESREELLPPLRRGWVLGAVLACATVVLGTVMAGYSSSLNDRLRPPPAPMALDSPTPWPSMTAPTPPPASPQPSAATPTPTDDAFGTAPRRSPGTSTDSTAPTGGSSTAPSPGRGPGAPATSTPSPAGPTTKPPPPTRSPKPPPPTRTPKPPPPSPTEPPPGRHVHKGDLTVNKAGTVLDNWDISGVVWIQAPNVTIRNSIVRGRTPATSGRALVSNMDGFKGLLIENTTIREEKPSPWNGAGVQGSHFTLRGVHIIGSVDNVQIWGSDVTIEDSTLENTVFYQSHWSQGGGPSHSDNIQVLRGDNIRISGNTIRGAQNFAVLGAPERGSMRNLVVRDNFVDGGDCTMKFSTYGGYPQSVEVRDNKVGRNQKSKNCGLVVVRGVDLEESGTVWSGSGRPVRITWYDA